MPTDSLIGMNVNSLYGFSILSYLNFIWIQQTKLSSIWLCHSEWLDPTSQYSDCLIYITHFLAAYSSDLCPCKWNTQCKCECFFAKVLQYVHESLEATSPKKLQYLSDKRYIFIHAVINTMHFETPFKELRICNHTFLHVCICIFS